MYSRNYFSPSVSFSLPAVAFLAAVGMVLIIAKSEALAQDCKPLHGHFIEQVFVPTGPDCNSPVGFCVRGRAIGVLKGDFLATLTSAIPSQDTPITAVVFFTVDLVLHTRDGDLLMKEAAASNQDPNGHGDLGDVVTVVGGTGKWVGATGRLRVWGNLTATEIDVNYEGNVCLP